MRPLFDDVDEFDFADSPSVARLLREQRLEETRFASRKSRGLGHRGHFDDREYDDLDDYDDDINDLDHEDDYDEREFDSWAKIGIEL